jgi:hypothetical protein
MSAESLSRSAAPWPRPMRQQRPLRGRLAALVRPPRLPAREAARGPPRALAAAALAWARNKRGRRLAELPRSPMRPGRTRNSVLSSRAMRVSLRRLTKQSSPIRRTSCHGDEMLAFFGEAHIAGKPRNGRAHRANPACRQIFPARRAGHTSCASILPSNGRRLLHSADTRPNIRQDTRTPDQHSGQLLCCAAANLDANACAHTTVRSSKARHSGHGGGDLAQCKPIVDQASANCGRPCKVAALEGKVQPMQATSIAT